MLLLMHLFMLLFSIFFFNDTATTEIYTLSLHDALPIYSLTADHDDGLCILGVPGACGCHDLGWPRLQVCQRIPTVRIGRRQRLAERGDTYTTSRPSRTVVHYRPGDGTRDRL